jgi:hypothetical protein
MNSSVIFMVEAYRKRVGRIFRQTLPTRFAMRATVNRATLPDGALRMRQWSLPLLLSLILFPLPISAQGPEEKPVPEDSLRIVAQGCLKGRVFTAISPSDPAEAEVVSTPDISGRSFRVSGPKAVMQDVKKHNKHLVKVVGLVRKSALRDNTPGARVGNTRIVIGSPQTMEPGGRPPMPGVAVLDLSSVQFLASACKP